MESFARRDALYRTFGVADAEEGAWHARARAFWCNIFNARDNPAQRIALRDAEVPSELCNLPARFLDRAGGKGGKVNCPVYRRMRPRA